MSRPLTLADIADLRAYERERAQFRAEVIAAKRLRRLALGPIVTAVLENRLTLRFQVQEMARAERMSTDEQIADELAVYNPLLPGAGELSMTLFIELTTEEELREWLPKLVGVERSVLVRIGEGDDVAEVTAVVDAGHASQLTREETTASVHYVKVALDATLAERFGVERAALAIEHPSYRAEHVLSAETKASVLADWADS